MQNKKVSYSWAMYDWANSVFSVTIMSGFFPVFFKKYWSVGTDPTVSTARLGILIAIGSLIIAVVSPLLGAVGDFFLMKKKFCFYFMVLGVLASTALAFVGGGEWELAGILFSLAQIGYAASCNFYDSLLPSIAQGKEADWLSGLGYGLGYLGGGILFAVNVAMYLKPEFFHLRDGTQAIQASFISVGIWWLLFSFPFFKNVPEPRAVNHFVPANWIRESFLAVFRTMKHIYQDRNLFIFVVAFWLYIDGVYTVITMAIDFGIALGFSPESLIVALLIVQFVGFPFALLYGKLAHSIESKKLIISCLVVYSITVFWASRMDQVWEFYVLALIVAMVQGGVQSLSRALFSRMIPVDKSGEFFGLFNLIGKFASVLGPLLMGLSAYFTKSNRLSMLSLLILFIIGGALLWRVREPAPHRDQLP